MNSYSDINNQSGQFNQFKSINETIPRKIWCMFLMFTTSFLITYLYFYLRFYLKDDFLIQNQGEYGEMVRYLFFVVCLINIPVMTSILVSRKDMKSNMLIGIGIGWIFFPFLINTSSFLSIIFFSTLGGFSPINIVDSAIIGSCMLLIWVFVSNKKLFLEILILIILIASSIVMNSAFSTKISKDKDIIDSLKEYAVIPEYSYLYQIENELLDMVDVNKLNLCSDLSGSKLNNCIYMFNARMSHRIHDLLNRYLRFGGDDPVLVNKMCSLSISRENCIRDYSISVEQCGSLPEMSFLGDMTYRDSCIANIADRKGNIEICNNLDGWIKERCVSGATRTRNHLDKNNI
jgi:hypothetical protein